MNMKLHSTLPLIIGVLVCLDSASSLPSSWCCYDRRQKRHICADSNEEDQFKVEDDGTERRRIRNYCIDSNEDFQFANTETADYSDSPYVPDIHKSSDYSDYPHDPNSEYGDYPNVIEDLKKQEDGKNTKEDLIQTLFDPCSTRKC